MPGYKTEIINNLKTATHINREWLLILTLKFRSSSLKAISEKTNPILRRARSFYRIVSVRLRSTYRPLLKRYHYRRPCGTSGKVSRNALPPKTTTTPREIQVLMNYSLDNFGNPNISVVYCFSLYR